MGRCFKKQALSEPGCRHGSASDAFKRLKILPDGHTSRLDLLGHQAGKVGLEPDPGFGRVKSKFPNFPEPQLSPLQKKKKKKNDDRGGLNDFKWERYFVNQGLGRLKEFLL